MKVKVFKAARAEFHQLCRAAGKKRNKPPPLLQFNVHNNVFSFLNRHQENRLVTAEMQQETDQHAKHGNGSAAFPRSSQSASLFV